MSSWAPHYEPHSVDTVMKDSPSQPRGLRLSLVPASAQAVYINAVWRGWGHVQNGHELGELRACKGPDHLVEIFTWFYMELQIP